MSHDAYDEVLRAVSLVSRSLDDLATVVNQRGTVPTGPYETEVGEVVAMNLSTLVETVDRSTRSLIRRHAWKLGRS